MSLASHQRYVFKPFTGSSHSWALSYCKTLPKDSNTLDIGSGSGAIGDTLISWGWTNLSAIEIDPAAQEYVKNIYSRIEDRIEKYQGQRFDVVFLLDVLEHMTTPEAYLKQLLDYVTPGGKILISVPNIAHWSIRFSLLFGFFQYTERGLLDKTHLQFFTKRRVLSFSKISPNLKILSTSSSIEPVELLLPKFIYNNSVFELLRKWRLALACAWSGLFAFQHLIVLEKQ